MITEEFKEYTKAAAEQYPLFLSPVYYSTNRGFYVPEDQLFELPSRWRDIPIQEIQATDLTYDADLGWVYRITPTQVKATLEMLLVRRFGAWAAGSVFITSRNYHYAESKANAIVIKLEFYNLDEVAGGFFSLDDIEYTIINHLHISPTVNRYISVDYGQHSYLTLQLHFELA